MKKGAVLGLISVFLLSGCGMFQYLDGSSDREVKNFNVSKTELLKEVQDLQSGNKALQETVDRQKAQIEQFEEKDRTNQKAASEGKTRIDGLEKEKSDLLEENKSLKAAATIKEVPIVEQKPKEPAPAVSAKKLRIKVLAGSGGLQAAQKMSAAIKDLGYKVERLDRTSTANVRSDTVYYARDAEREARDLAARIGKQTLVKPLTWSSVFDLIVVAK